MHARTKYHQNLTKEFQLSEKIPNTFKWQTTKLAGLEKISAPERTQLQKITRMDPHMSVPLQLPSSSQWPTIPILTTIQSNPTTSNHIQSCLIQSHPRQSPDRIKPAQHKTPHQSLPVCIKCGGYDESTNSTQFFQSYHDWLEEIFLWQISCEWIKDLEANDHHQTDTILYYGQY